MWDISIVCARQSTTTRAGAVDTPDLRGDFSHYVQPLLKSVSHPDTTGRYSFIHIRCLKVGSAVIYIFCLNGLNEVLVKCSWWKPRYPVRERNSS